MRGPTLAYTFNHALTHDVAYRGLPDEQRRDLHARVVEAIERLYRDRLPEHVGRLAYHAFEGEVWDKAVSYLRQAGDRAYAHSLAREATAYFEQALAALRHLPETRTAIEQAIDLRIELRNQLAQVAEYDRALERLREAEGLATAIDDRRRLGRAVAYILRPAAGR